MCFFPAEVIELFKPAPGPGMTEELGCPMKEFFFYLVAEL